MTSRNHNSVQLVSESIWEPRLDEETLTTECVACGKTTDSKEESLDLGDDGYEVCCTLRASNIK